MAARIEFIPLGHRWEPQGLIIPDGLEKTFYRLPNDSRLERVTPIVISTVYANHTLVECTYPGETSPNQVQLSSHQETFIIYRAMLMNTPHGGRGTIRITHLPPSEDDNERLKRSEPSPLLSARAEEADPTYNAIVVDTVLAVSAHDIDSQRIVITN